MAKIDIWPVIKAERTTLATDLRALGEDQWSRLSLCSEWTVRDVLAHMTATAKITPATFFGKMAGSGFSFTKLQAKDIAAEKGRSPADTLARFEAVLNSRKHPPGPADTMLGETIIHAEDIRGPLGIRHDYPADAVVQVADFYKNSNLILGTKRRIAGPGPRGDRHRVVPRHRAQGGGPHPGPGHGHDRAQGNGQRAHRRRRGDAAVTFLAAGPNAPAGTRQRPAPGRRRRIRPAGGS